MTDKPDSAGPAEVDATPSGSAAAEAEGSSAERVVIRNRRKIDPSGGAHHSADHQEQDHPQPGADRHDAAADGRPDDAMADLAAVGFGAELAALRAELEERTRDLQRVTAEYANYRKRVDRDRGLAAEQTTGAVLSALLPVLDDLDRAREHGDLVGPIATVAEHLTAALSKFGLTVFGDKGDPFDPTRHEAVAHLTSADVTEPTCIDVMRRGYLLGERLLRPAMVAVADPE